MNPRDIHKLEQGTADIRTQFVPMVRAFYNGCTDAGWTDREAMELTKTYLHALVMGMMRPGPKPEEL